MLNIVIFGAPGSGKGTQSDRLIEAYGLHHISTGEVLRDHISRGTELGRIANSYISKGQLIPDDLMIRVLEHLIDSNPDYARDGVIFDGFPRTIPQAEMLEGLVSDVKVVNFEIKDEIVIKRLSTRRVCKACGANYNVLTLKPKVEGICDKCGGELYQRDDDKQESILHRMDVYREQTEPLINFYKEKGKITDLDASIETDILLGKFKEIFK